MPFVISQRTGHRALEAILDFLGHLCFCHNMEQLVFLGTSGSKVVLLAGEAEDGRPLGVGRELTLSSIPWCLRMAAPRPGLGVTWETGLYCVRVQHLNQPS